MCFRPSSADESAETRKRLGVEDNFLLFVGTLEPRKNLLTLLKALAQILRETQMRPQLVIAGGEGWLMTQTESFIESAGIKDRLLFTGYLQDEELSALYSSCGAFIYPSLYEGFGLPPLEAMACGAPVIASRIAASQEILRDAAVLIDPLDSESLTRAIVDFLKDDKRSKESRMRGLEHAAKFSWDKAARSTYEVYERTVVTRK